MIYYNLHAAPTHEFNFLLFIYPVLELSNIKLKVVIAIFYPECLFGCEFYYVMHYI